MEWEIMSVADVNLQERVLEELKWEPSVDAGHIGVSADDHVVTLTGNVPSYYQKIAYRAGCGARVRRAGDRE